MAGQTPKDANRRKLEAQKQCVVFEDRRNEIRKSRDELSTRKAEMVVKAEDDRNMLLKPGAEPDIPTLDQRLQSWGPGPSTSLRLNLGQRRGVDQMKAAISSAKERLETLKDRHERTQQQVEEYQKAKAQKDVSKEERDADNASLYQDGEWTTPTLALVQEERARWEAARAGQALKLTHALFHAILNEVVEAEIQQAYKEMQQLDREAENFATHVLVSAISRKFSTAVPTGEFEQHKYSQYMNRELVTEATIARDRMRELMEQRRDWLLIRARGRNLDPEAGPASQNMESADEMQTRPNPNVEASGEGPNATDSERAAKNPSANLEINSDAQGELQQPKPSMDPEPRSRDYEHNKQESQEDEAKLQTEAMRRCAMRSILKGMQQRRDALDSPGDHKMPESMNSIIRRAQRAALQHQALEAQALKGVQPPPGPLEPSLPDVLKSIKPARMINPGPELPIGHWPSQKQQHVSHTERAFWSQVAFEEDPFLSDDAAPIVQLPKNDAAVTSVAATRSGAFLAVGTSSGSVFVWDMRYPTPQLIRAAKAIPLLDPPQIPAVPDVFLSEPDKQKQATETQNQEPIPAPKALRLLRFLKFKQRATPKVRDSNAERKDSNSSDDAASSEMQSLINNTAVLGLAWDNAGTQLVAVVGQYEVHIWSLGMERLADEAVATMRHLSSWTPTDLYSAGTGVVKGPTPADALEYMTRQRIMPAVAFNPGFTLGGHQPFAMIPRASGDVVQVRTHLSHKLTYTVWGAGPRQPPKEHRDKVDVEIQDTIHASKGGGESNDSKRNGSTSDAESANIPEQAQDQSASLTNPSPVTAVDSIPSSQTKRESAGGSKYGVGEQASIDILGTLKQCLGSEPVQDYATQRSILREMFHPDLPKNADGVVNPIELEDCKQRYQDLYRGHNAPVVHVDFIPQTAAMVSVDSEGSLLIWPPEDASRSGYGWFMPTHHYGLPGRLPVFVPQPNRSDLLIDARTDPAINQSEGEASAAANLDPDARVSSNPSPETGLRTDGIAETDLPKDSEQDVLQARELEADNDGETDILGPPQGDGLNPNPAATEDAFWEEERILWLVKYEWESKTLIQNRVERPIVRSSFDKDAMVATSFAVSTTTTSGETHSTKRVKQQFAVVEDRYSLLSGSLVSSSATSLTLLLVGMSSQFMSNNASHAEGASTFPHFTAITVCANTDRQAALTASVPRIDFPAFSKIDKSQGFHLPVFALQPTVDSLGTDYMYAPVGPTEVGVYSLATGTMVHEFTLTKCQSTNGIQSMKAVPTQEGTAAGLLVFGIRGTAEVHIMRVNQMHAMTVTMLNVVPEVSNPLLNPLVIEPFRVHARRSSEILLDESAEDATNILQ